MAVKRIQAEIGTALLTGTLGVVAIFGAVDLGTGWGESGPQSGYFPFWVATVLIGASLWNLGRAVQSHLRASRAATTPVPEPFLPRAHLIRVATFMGAMVAFVIGLITVGFYVASTLYIGLTAWRQGGLPLAKGLAIGAIFAVALFVIFEVIFQIPLLKGPIEPLLGIY